MLGVDTNVLVRFLADDDDVQTPLAALVLSKDDNQPIFVSALVLAESFTVLTKVKKFPAAKVIEAMRQLASSGFTIETKELVLAALDHAEQARCGLPDALIALQNASMGCRTTATFDHRAQRLAGMTAVEDLA